MNLCIMIIKRLERGVFFLKGILFRKLDRLDIWIEERRKNIFLLVSLFFILASLVLAIHFSMKIYAKPLFPEPETLAQYMINSPFIIFMLVMAIVLFFGLFVSLVVTLSPFKRMKIAKMELEFENQKKEAKVSEQFSFVSSILGSYYSVVGRLKRERRKDILSITNNIVQAYEKFYNEMNNDQGSNIEVKIVEKEENMSKTEIKLLNHLRTNELDVDFWNRFPGKENILIGITETEEAIIIVKSPSNFNFYDAETLKSIVMYIPILFYTVNLQEYTSDNDE